MAKIAAGINQTTEIDLINTKNRMKLMKKTILALIIAFISTITFADEKPKVKKIEHVDGYRAVKLNMTQKQILDLDICTFKDFGFDGVVQTIKCNDFMSSSGKKTIDVYLLGGKASRVSVSHNHDDIVVILGLLKEKFGMPSSTEPANYDDFLNKRNSTMRIDWDNGVGLFIYQSLLGKFTMSVLYSVKDYSERMNSEKRKLIESEI